MMIRRAIARNKVRVAVLTIALVLTLPATAGALTISRFAAHATSTTVSYAIDYCDGRARVHEHFAFFALDRSSGVFTDDAYAGIGGGCYVASGRFPNRFLQGLWELKLTMTDSRGTLLRRSTRVYLP